MEVLFIMVDFEAEIRSIMNQIIYNYHPDRIILFGSCAKGQNTANSDIDLLIIKNTDKRPIERLHEVHKPLDYNIPVDLLVYTPDEVEIYLSDETGFLSQILREGKVLYDNELQKVV